jgi:hypothetical protein
LFCWDKKEACGIGEEKEVPGRWGRCTA